jgi:uncharacterized protein
VHYRPETALLDQRVTYDGTQLTTHWPRGITGLQGDALVAWLGPARVDTAELVDLSDRSSGDTIVAAEMLHLVGVFFQRPLPEMVMRQRLYTARLAEELGRRGVAPERSGDDLFLPGEPPRKLTVSIATVSPLAGLIHLGINVDPAGAPVPAAGLEELGVAARPFAAELLAALVEEETGAALAAAKVRAVN